MKWLSSLVNHLDLPAGHFSFSAALSLACQRSLYKLIFIYYESTQLKNNRSNSLPMELNQAAHTPVSYFLLTLLLNSY